MELWWIVSLKLKSMWRQLHADATKYVHTIQKYFKTLPILVIANTCKFGFKLWRKTILTNKVCKDNADISCIFWRYRHLQYRSLQNYCMMWKLVYSPTYSTSVWLTFCPVCLWWWGRGSGWRYWSTPADCTPRSKIGRNWRERRESHSPIRRTNSAFRLRTRRLCARDIR